MFFVLKYFILLKKTTSGLNTVGPREVVHKILNFQKIGFCVILLLPLFRFFVSLCCCCKICNNAICSLLRITIKYVHTHIANMIFCKYTRFINSLYIFILSGYVSIYISYPPTFSLFLFIHYFYFMHVLLKATGPYMKSLTRSQVKTN